MKPQPIATAPRGRIILVKHRKYGWIEAEFNDVVYAQSIRQHGRETGGFGWDSPSHDTWLHHKDMLAWAELPENNE